MDLHRRGMRKETINKIKPYQDLIHKMYWEMDMGFKEISEVLNFVSHTSIYRYMVLFDKVRTKEEQLQHLKKLNTGRIWTEEAKHNVSIGVKKSYENNDDLRMERSESNKRRWNKLTEKEKEIRVAPGLKSVYGNRVGNSMSSIEYKVANQLTDNNIRYIQQKRIYDSINDKLFYLDFYIPEYKLVIECNGDYWHSKPKRIERDKMLKEYVKSTGRKIIFIWEHEIKDEWFNIMDYIKEVL